jgi:hypothetical protein
MGAALERAAAKRKRGMAYVSGIHRPARRNAGRGDRHTGPVVRAWLVLSERPSGLADIVAVHKWFLAALKGHGDVIALRGEVAEQKSDEQITRAQRNARA